MSTPMIYLLLSVFHPYPSSYPAYIPVAKYANEEECKKAGNLLDSYFKCIPVDINYNRR
jgi:hypothetical protein